jgi:hypothetical protein
MRAPSTLSYLGQIDFRHPQLSEGGVFIELNRQNKLKDDPASFRPVEMPIEMEIFITEAGTAIKAQGKAVWVEKKVPGQEAELCPGSRGSVHQLCTYDSSIIRQFVASVRSGDRLIDRRKTDTEAPYLPGKTQIIGRQWFFLISSIDFPEGRRNLHHQ